MGIKHRADKGFSEFSESLKVPFRGTVNRSKTEDIDKTALLRIQKP